MPLNAYDDRSWIKNGLFRNSKQLWTLTGRFPQKDAAGVHMHLTFVMLMVAPAYRLWDKAQSETPASLSSHLALPAIPSSRKVRSEKQEQVRPHALLEG